MNRGIYGSLDGLDGWGYAGKSESDNPYGPKPELYKVKAASDPGYTGAGGEATKLAASIDAIAKWDAQQVKLGIKIAKDKTVEGLTAERAALQAQLEKLKAGPSPAVVVGGVVAGGVLIAAIAAVIVKSRRGAR